MKSTTEKQSVTIVADEKATIGETGRLARFAHWETLGVDRVKNDLLNGGFRLIGGPPEVRELAWEWVRLKEREADEKREIVQLKPTLWGIGIDLRRLWDVWLKPRIRRIISR